MPKMATQIRLDENNYKKLKQIADRELRSLNAQMEYFLIKGVEQYEKENGIVNVDYLYEGAPEIDY